MLSEPPAKRAFVFIVGQNLFHAAKEAFGYSFPNYDVAESVITTSTTTTLLVLASISRKPYFLTHLLISFPPWAEPQAGKP